MCLSALLLRSKPFIYVGDLYACSLVICKLGSHTGRWEKVAIVVVLHLRQRLIRIYARLRHLSVVDLLGVQPRVRCCESQEKDIWTKKMMQAQNSCGCVATNETN